MTEPDPIPPSEPPPGPADAAPAPVTTPAGERSAPAAEPAAAAPEASAPVSGAPAPDAGPQLRALFPALFGREIKPIKLHIQQEIQARAPGLFSRRALSAFLGRYTRSTAYLIAVSRGSQRFGLDGEASGELSEEHRDGARQELARRRASRQEREALEAGQRRNRATLLRDFERTTLTAANFCALKGIDVDALDGLLAQARAEAAAPAGAMADPRRDPRPPRRR